MLLVGELRHYLSAQIKSVLFLVPKTVDIKKIEEIEKFRRVKKKKIRHIICILFL